MNSTVLSNESIVRYIVQNVTEHLQEDEKDSFLLAYALLALITCLIISLVSGVLELPHSIWISNKLNWFPSVAVYMVIGFVLQKFIIFKLSSKYNQSVQENYTQYTSLLTFCFLPLQMFQYG